MEEPNATKVCLCCGRRLEFHEFSARASNEKFDQNCKVCIVLELTNKNIVPCDIFPVVDSRLPKRFRVERVRESDSEHKRLFLHQYQLKHPMVLRSAQIELLDSILWMQFFWTSTQAELGVAVFLIVGLYYALWHFLFCLIYVLFAAAWDVVCLCLRRDREGKFSLPGYEEPITTNTWCLSLFSRLLVTYDDEDGNTVEQPVKCFDLPETE